MKDETRTCRNYMLHFTWYPTSHETISIKKEKTKERREKVKWNGKRREEKSEKRRERERYGGADNLYHSSTVGC